MKIVCSGGGTLGPVTPVLGLLAQLKNANYDVEPVWVATKRGPERELLDQEGIRWTTIAAGKYRRYTSWRNIIDPVFIVIGFFQAMIFLWKEKPTCCLSAGGYNAVPVHWAAWLLGIPTWIHQQDITIGLANKLMAPVATVITTSLSSMTAQFPAKKTYWLGNPVRQDIFGIDRQHAREQFGVPEGLPVVFVTGGGTGSLRVNQLLVEALPHLDGECFIIHLSGKERPKKLLQEATKHTRTYAVYDFFTTQMKEAYAAADLVISRGGFGTLTELAALKKAVIVIPKTGQQEENVAYLAKAGAVKMVFEHRSDGYALAKMVKTLLADTQTINTLGNRLHDMLPPADQAAVIKVLRTLTKDV